MSSLLSTLGLRPTATGLEPPNHAAGFVIANFTWAYYILSSRFIKMYYRIDDNVAPREAMATRGERMVKEGKVTKSVLDQIKRLEGAHANSVEHFSLFFGTLLFAMHAGLPSSTINSFCAAYSVSRFAYAMAYVFATRRKQSLVRSLLWAVSCSICFWTLVKASKAINA